MAGQGLSRRGLLSGPPAIRLSVKPLPGGSGSETTTDRNPGVVNKVGFAVGINCRILSGGFGMMRWSIGYSQ